MATPNTMMADSDAIIAMIREQADQDERYRLLLEQFDVLMAEMEQKKGWLQDNVQRVLGMELSREEEVQALRAENDQLQTQLHDLRNSILHGSGAESLAQQLEASRDMMEEVRSQIEAVQGDMREVDLAMEAAFGQMDEVKAEQRKVAGQLQSSVRSLRGAFEALKKEVKEWKPAVERAANTQQQQHQEAVQKLEEDKLMLASRHSLLKHQFQELLQQQAAPEVTLEVVPDGQGEEQLRQVRQDCEALQEELHAVREELQVAQAQARHRLLEVEEATQLQQAAENMREKAEAAWEEAEAARKEALEGLEVKRELVEALQATSRSQWKHLAALEDELQAKKAEVEHQQELVEQLQGQLQEAAQGRSGSAQEAERLTAVATDLRDELSREAAAATAAKRLCLELEERVASLQQQLANNEAATAAKVQADEDARSADAAALRASAEKLAGKLREAEREYARKLEALQRQQEQLQDRVESGLARQAEAVDALSARAQALAVEVEGMVVALQAAAAAAGAADRHRPPAGDRLQQELQATQEQLQALAAQVAALAEQQQTHSSGAATAASLVPSAERPRQEVPPRDGPAAVGCLAVQDRSLEQEHLAAATQKQLAELRSSNLKLSAEKRSLSALLEEKTQVAALQEATRQLALQVGEARVDIAQLHQHILSSSASPSPPNLLTPLLLHATPAGADSTIHATVLSGRTSPVPSPPSWSAGPVPVPDGPGDAESSWRIASATNGSPPPQPSTVVPADSRSAPGASPQRPPPPPSDAASSAGPLHCQVVGGLPGSDELLVVRVVQNGPASGSASTFSAASPPTLLHLPGTSPAALQKLHLSAAKSSPQSARVPTSALSRAGFASPASVGELPSGSSTPGSGYRPGTGMLLALAGNPALRRFAPPSMRAALLDLDGCGSGGSPSEAASQMEVRSLHE